MCSAPVWLLHVGRSMRLPGGLECDFGRLFSPCTSKAVTDNITQSHGTVHGERERDVHQLTSRFRSSAHQSSCRRNALTPAIVTSGAQVQPSARAATMAASCGVIVSGS